MLGKSICMPSRCSQIMGVSRDRFLVGLGFRVVPSDPCY